MVGTRCGLTSDKAAGVDEYAPINTGRLAQIVISQAAPCLWEGLATLKAFWRDRDGLDTPVACSLVGIDDVDGLEVLFQVQLALDLEEMLLEACQKRQSTLAMYAYFPRRILLEQDDFATGVYVRPGSQGGDNEVSCR